LPAVDDSENARRAAAYVGHMHGGAKDSSVTLLHVISDPEKDYFAKIEEKQKGLEHYRQRVKTFLDQYRSRRSSQTTPWRAYSARRSS
jgi:hypothetical protein